MKQFSAGEKGNILQQFGTGPMQVQTIVSNTWCHVVAPFAYWQGKILTIVDSAIASGVYLFPQTLVWYKLVQMNVSTSNNYFLPFGLLKTFRWATSTLIDLAHR